MKAAVFFQIHDRGVLASILKKIYFTFFLRSNKRRIQYLRDGGAKIGEGVTIGNTEILGSEPCLVEIGNHVYFSGGDTRILTHDGSMSLAFDMGIASQRFDLFGRVRIGNNCFIGINSIIMKNVTIGDNCVIGAGSIVTKDVPSGSVVCGVPAKIIDTTSNLYKKHLNELHDTHGWNRYRKRLYLESKFKI